MSKEELFKVFDWLEKNVNKSKLFYFKYEDKNSICAYFKDNNKIFAQFYVKQILKILSVEENK